MRDKYGIRYLPIAQDDLISIFDHIAGDSASRVAGFVNKLDKRIGSLRIQPLMGRIPRNEKLKAIGYRVLIIESYFVFYLLRDHIIEIHRVIHGSRNLDDLV